MMERAVRTRLFTWSNSSASDSVSLVKASWSTGTLDAVYRRMMGGMMPGGMRRTMVCDAAVICAIAALTSAPGCRYTRMTLTPS